MEKTQIYRGIEFIQISDLPVDQQQPLKDWLSGDMLFKILKQDEKILPDCVQFKHYSEWYTTVYSVVPQTEPSKEEVKSKGLKGIKLAMGR